MANCNWRGMIPAWYWYQNICHCTTDFVLRQQARIYPSDILGSIKYDLIMWVVLNVMVISGFDYLNWLNCKFIFHDYKDRQWYLVYFIHRNMTPKSAVPTAALHIYMLWFKESHSPRSGLGQLRADASVWEWSPMCIGKKDDWIVRWVKSFQWILISWKVQSFMWLRKVLIIAKEFVWVNEMIIASPSIHFELFTKMIIVSFTSHYPQDTRAICR